MVKKKKSKVKKPRGRKPLRAKDLSKVLGECYLCKRPVTKNMITTGKGLSIGQGKYRCRSRKCEKKVIDAALKQMHAKRKVWIINPVTRITPNTKKKSRAKIKREFKKETE